MSGGVEVTRGGEVFDDNYGGEWDGVAALAGKMGELGDEDGIDMDSDSSVSGEAEKRAKRKELYDRLEWLVKVNDGEVELSDDVDPEKLAIEWYDEVRKGRWWEDDEFIGYVADRYDDGDVSEFLEYGMPVSKIIDNPKYYEKMMEHFRLPVGALGQIYEEMSKTPEGVEKFRRDFSDRINVQWTTNSIMNGEYGDDDAMAIGDLRAARACGVPVLGHLFVNTDVRMDDFGSWEAEIEERKKIGHDFVKRLIEEGLVGSNDLSALYGTSKGYLSSESRGAIEALLESGIEPEEGDEFGQYWYKLSKERGRNVFFLIFAMKGMMTLILGMSRHSTPC